MGSTGTELPVNAGRSIEHHLQPVPLYENRLSLPFFIRFPTATAIAFLTGAALGISHGGKTVGLRFRAENSHRLPTTSPGWYLYHKSKNYNVILGGIKEAMKMGPKVGFWAGSFFIVEEAVDTMRGTKDFLSTVIAGTTIAAGFSGQMRNVLPLNTAARTIRTGLYSGLAFGLFQDALGLARGRRLGYVDFLLGRNRDVSKSEEIEA